MKLFRRIVVTVIVTLCVILAGIYWIVPIALSYYSAREAPAVARVVPSDLQDLRISPTPGAKLSYIGCEFEVPWTDLDQSKTKLYPEGKPEKTKVVLSFRSGLRLEVTALPAREFANGFTSGSIGVKVSPAAFEAMFGHEAVSSDYGFTQRVYEFTPEKMHHWSFRQAIFAREEVLLVIKSMMLTKPAETGIFNIRNADYQGFQQGNPCIRQNWLLVDLYSDNGGVEVGIIQEHYANPLGVTQREINRIVQSLHRTADSRTLATK